MVLPWKAPVPLLKKGIKVIDLGADFRITDRIEWSKWYGMEHTQAALLESAVYGLPETNRTQVKEAMLLANPGCYPTAVQLALKPLITNKTNQPIWHCGRL